MNRDRRVLYAHTSAAGARLVVEALPDRNGEPRMLRIIRSEASDSSKSAIWLGPVEAQGLRRALAWFDEETAEIAEVRALRVRHETVEHDVPPEVA